MLLKYRTLNQINVGYEIKTRDFINKSPNHTAAFEVGMKLTIVENACL